jgi:fibronectin type 3 domain-containing protein
LGSFSSCAKVGEPQPPFVRIPEAVKDLTANQSGYNIVLSWTNPSRNIDQSAATNLAHVKIRSGEATIATVNVIGAGQPQSYAIPVTPGPDSLRTFSIIVDTKSGKTSNVSNTASAIPVEVPGRVAGIHAVVDQRRITLTWSKPGEHPELVISYVVTRSDRPGETESVSDTQYEDMRYQRGKTVTYQVAPIRRVGDRTVAGIVAESMPVSIEDTTPPQVPTGLDIVESDNSAHLTWEANTETDLAGYYVFRSKRAEGPFELVSKGVITANYFVDPDYKPGTYYSVSAIDEFGNKSPRSPAFRGP